MALTSALPWLWYGALFAIGVGIILAATPWGIGIRTDSLSYLTAAQNLARGDCLCWNGSGLEPKPLVHFGPVYPSLLAAVSRLGPDVLAAARVVTAALYGANLAGWGLVVHQAGRRFWAGAAVSGLLLASSVFLRIHDAAMSEPLFLLLALFAFWELTTFLAGGRSRDLVVAALATAAAVLTRYAAGGLVLAGTLGILALGAGSIRERFRAAGAYAGLSILPVLAWLARNFVAAGTLTNRTFRQHVVNLDRLRDLLDVVAYWFTPSVLSHWIEAAALLAALSLAGIVLWRRRQAESPASAVPANLGLLWLVFAVAYVGQLLVSRSFFDDSIPFDDRILSPLYVLFAGVAGLLAALLWGGRWRWLVAGAALAFALAAGPHVLNETQAKFTAMRTSGVGLAGPAWARSESVAWARSLPAHAIVYSNQALALQLLTGRPAYQLPEGFDSVKAEPRTDLAANLARMRAALRQPDSYLLAFDPVRPPAPGAVDETFLAGLHQVLELEDGFVYARPSEEGAALPPGALAVARPCVDRAMVR